jgi:hypothetical protein
MDATNMSTNMSATMDYQDFIAAKVAAAPEMGFSAPLPLHDSLFPHQRAIVDWAITRGRAAIFAAFGLGKTRMQIELARQTCEHTSGRFLIVAPLGVRQEFMRDAAAMGVSHHLHPPHVGGRRDRDLHHQLRVRARRQRGRLPQGRPARVRRRDPSTKRAACEASAGRRPSASSWRSSRATTAAT